MARASASTTTSKTRKPSTRAASDPVKAPRAGRPPSRAGKAAASPTAKLSKEELRSQVEKLERANDKLRAKGREFGRAGRQAADRIAELESEVARLERQLKRQAPKAAAPAPARRQRRREIDPGDAVPPGVAVEEPEPLDKEAETALAALEEHLPSELDEE